MIDHACPICGRPVLRPQAITCTAICARKRRLAMAQGKPVTKPAVSWAANWAAKWERESARQIRCDIQHMQENDRAREKRHERRRLIAQWAVLFAKGWP